MINKTIEKKTKGMLIRSNILLDVRFENVKIDFLDNFKYLGLILDKDSLHIKRLKYEFLALLVCSGGLGIFFHFLAWHQYLGSNISLFDK
jgi:hypothetical protein